MSQASKLCQACQFQPSAPAPLAAQSAMSTHPRFFLRKAHQDAQRESSTPSGILPCTAISIRSSRITASGRMLQHPCAVLLALHSSCMGQYTDAMTVMQCGLRCRVVLHAIMMLGLPGSVKLQKFGKIMLFRRMRSSVCMPCALPRWLAALQCRLLRNLHMKQCLAHVPDCYHEASGTPCTRHQSARCPHTLLSPSRQGCCSRSHTWHPAAQGRLAMHRQLHPLEDLSEAVHDTSVVSAAVNIACVTIFTGRLAQHYIKACCKRCDVHGTIHVLQSMIRCRVVCMPVKGLEWLCIAESGMLFSASLAAIKLAARMTDACAACVCSGSRNRLLKPLRMCTYGLYLVSMCAAESNRDQC